MKHYPVISKNRFVIFLYFLTIITVGTIFSTYATFYDFDIQVKKQLFITKPTEIITLNVQQLVGDTYETTLQKSFEILQEVDKNPSQNQIEVLSKSPLAVVPESDIFEQLDIGKAKYFFNLPELGSIWVSSRGDLLCCGFDKTAGTQAKSLNITSSCRVVLADIIGLKKLKVKSNASATKGMVYVADEAIFDIDSEFVNFGCLNVGELYITAELFVNQKKIEAFGESTPAAEPKVNIKAEKAIFLKGSVIKDGSKLL